MEQDERYMREALREAMFAAEEDEVPIGAVIVCRGRIIGKGRNMTERLNDPTAHAEILAIKKAAEKTGDFRLTGAELYVTLEPCPMCAGAAVNARIDEIIFGAADPVKGALGSVTNLYSFNFPNKPTVFGGIREKECSKILQEFFKAKR